MINHLPRLELFVVGSAFGADSDEPSEDSTVNRAVNQSSRGVTQAEVYDEGMGLPWVNSSLWKFHYHADPPWIASEKPISEGALHFLKGAVSGQLAVKDTLGKHRGGEIVRAPD